MSSNKTAAELADEKLSSSGIDAEQAAAIGVYSVDNAAALHPSYQALPALVVPYFDVAGEPLSPLPHWPPFYRLRYLKSPPSFGGKKAQRYAQEPDSGVCAYFSRGAVDWVQTATDVSVPLLITEGELKAAKACIDGYPTIGLGGVYNFRSQKTGCGFLPELEAITWPRRCVYITFDSDYRSNPMVVNAMMALAEELCRRGALPFIVSLPEGEHGKVGLDDYLVEHGAESLAPLLSAAESLTLAKGLWDLNRRVTYIRNPGLVVDRKTSQKMTPSAFATHAFANREYYKVEITKDGATRLVRAFAAPDWLKWPMRDEVGSLTYKPGAETVIVEDGETSLNTWRGWGVEAKRGDVKPWLKMFKRLFGGAPPEFRKWVLQWIAYPIQHPGTKLYTSLVVHGRGQGTGKTFFGVTLGAIYGTNNYTMIDQGMLDSEFNSWAEGKQFVVGDEVTGSEKRKEADMLKNLITRDRVTINEKFVPAYTIPDCVNYYFTSNHCDAFFLEDLDRRFAIHEVLDDTPDPAFFAVVDAWLRDGGASHLRAFLERIDLTGFNPKGPAPMTLAKERMIADGRSEHAAWVSQLVNDPDAVLRLGDTVLQGDLWTARELLSHYDIDKRTRLTTQGLSKELKRAGVRQVCDGRLIRTDKSIDRYYALRNADKWLGAALAEVQQHLRSTKRQ